MLFGAYGGGQAQAFAPDIVKAASAAERVFKILDEPEDEQKEGEAKIEGRAKGQIQFEDVWFKYPTRS